MIRNIAKRAALALVPATLAVLAVAPAAGAAVPSSLFGPDPRTPTALTALGVPPGSLHLEGTLTKAGGAPVAGATVTFTTLGSSRVMCTAVTNAAGLAQCDISGLDRTIARSVGGVWWTNFAGNATLQPTKRAGHI